MHQPNTPGRSVAARLLASLDRVPGLGGGRTHIVFLGMFFLGSLSMYLTVLKLRGPAAGFTTQTDWDRAIPFEPWWTWIYMSPYVTGPLLVGLLSRSAFVWYVQRATLVVAVSLVIFAAVPTQTVRPLKDPENKAKNEAKLGDDLTSRLYRQMDEIDDPPANAAPSLHVSLSCLLAWALFYEQPRWWPVILLAAVMVWLSTLYTAQHHLIDVGSGALLASLAAIGRPQKSS